MLLQFSVENFLSFDELTHFSMLAIENQGHPTHILRQGGLAAVKGAAIYGANAAGKSNLIAAMAFSQRLILNGVRPGEGFGNRPFAFGRGGERPTRFDWIFYHEKVTWSYSLTIETTQVIEESLYFSSEHSTKEQMVFERYLNADGRSIFQFGDFLRGEEGSRQAQILEFVAEGCRAEQPFVTEARERNIGGLSDFHNWFSECLQISTTESGWDKFKRVVITFASEQAQGMEVPKSKDISAFEPVLVNNNEFIQFLDKFLRYADTGIERVEWHKEPLSPETLATLDDDLKRLIDIVTENRKAEAQCVSFSGGRPVLVQFDSEGLWLFTPRAVHIDAHGNEQQLSFGRESAGTRRLLLLIPWLFQLYVRPTVLVVDELDQHLHTLLARAFVEQALSERNAMGQLIFTTHDTNLLDSWLLRRDEIWFVQKNQGQSSLSRLSEWEVSQNTDLEKAYLLGRFEGRPFFGFAPSLQGADVPFEAKPPTEDELRQQLKEVA